jgi:hypothetical protein
MRPCPSLQCSSHRQSSAPYHGRMWSHGRALVCRAAVAGALPCAWWRAHRIHLRYRRRTPPRGRAGYAHDARCTDCRRESRWTESQWMRRTLWSGRSCQLAKRWRRAWPRCDDASEWKTTENGSANDDENESGAEEEMKGRLDGCGSHAKARSLRCDGAVLACAPGDGWCCQSDGGGHSGRRCRALPWLD